MNAFSYLWMLQMQARNGMWIRGQQLIQADAHVFVITMLLALKKLPLADTEIAATFLHFP